ncbi:MAG: TetR/AcrR family transcriptional regulator [Lachnospiraceae bacterium]|nr:TetR/AcrR family transcriptional regulator [Lachnospiraceae bacterium]
MNTPNNKRRRESREKIEKVFIELLRNNSLENITVSELCKIAKINRSTFYSNYDDIYALADSIRTGLETQLDEVYQDEILNGYNSNDFEKLFRHIKDNQIFYNTYFKLGFDNNYKIVKFDHKLAEQHFGNKYIEYHCEFFRAAITSIIKMWLKNGCKESPEEMADIIRQEYRGRQETAGK